MESRIIAYLHKEMDEKLTRCLYRLYQDKGIKISKSALVRALIEAYLEDNGESTTLEQVAS